MAAAVIPVASITRISSVPLGGGPGKSLAVVDFWIEQEMEDGDWLTADNLGVENIRAVLGVMGLANGGADWDTDIDVSDVTARLEKRARIAAEAAGSEHPDSDKANDADLIVCGAAFATSDGFWIQILAEV